TWSKRSRSAAQLRTVAESGLQGYEIDEWNALFASAGTPQEMIGRLNSELGKSLRAPEMQERLFQMGAEAAPGTPEQLDEYVRRELAKWDKVVKDVGIKVD